MSLYQLSEIKFPQLKKPENIPKFLTGGRFYVVLMIFFTLVLGTMGGVLGGIYVLKENIIRINQINNQKVIVLAQEDEVISAVKNVSPAVVSIIISKNLPLYEECYINPFGDLFPGFQIPQICQRGTRLQEIGGGSGFIVSSEGLILTNKHVVSDKEAEYTVLMNDGKKYSAKVLALDPSQDLAIIKIENGTSSLPAALLGDSDSVQIGQTAITIGNALGEFRNTVSVGVVSGLSRTITASGGGLTETIEDLIQTDAAINSGNSGGPLLNLEGEVVGINTARVSDAQSIGFAIPINKAKKDIESVKISGKIIYPFLGVRYVLVDDDIKAQNNLSVDYGAWIQRGDGGQAAITKGSAAQAAGLKEGDIILEFAGQKITTKNTLAKIIMRYNPGDKVVLKVLRDDKENAIDVVLGERSE
ncbi:MAG: trypsin-like peptidase domain-containing protein [Parcubacteria group bacterium]